MRGSNGVLASGFGVYPFTWAALNTWYSRQNSKRDRELTACSFSSLSWDSARPSANFQNATDALRSPFRTCAPRSCHWGYVAGTRSEEHTSELQSHLNLVCRLLL